MSGRVVHHYSELNLERLHADGERILEPVRLTAGEREDLAAFLRSLSDPKALKWRRTAARDGCTR